MESKAGRAAPRSLRERYGRPFAQRDTGPKSLETLFKGALSTGRLNLSARRLDRVPVREFLEAASSGVEGVSFWEVVDLVNLDISSNCIERLPEELAHLASLEVLNAHCNPLQAVPWENLEMPELLAMNVSDCAVRSIRTQAHLLPKIKRLAASANPLDEITGLETLGSLLELDLARCSLTCCPELPATLRTLDLSGNTIDELPPSMSQLHGLQSLDLSGNQLAQLPDLAGLASIEYLSLRENQLTSCMHLPTSTSLHTVLLGRNRLRTLDAPLSACPNIAVLDLSDNQLASIPEVLCALAKLTTLDLTNNNLSGLPPGLGYIASLTRLAIQGNIMRQLKPSVRDGNVQLLKKYLRSRGPPSEHLDPKYRCAETMEASVGELAALEASAITDRVRAAHSGGILNLSGLKLQTLRGAITEQAAPILGDGRVHLVNLQGNSLTSEALEDSQDFFASFTEATALDLSNNSIHLLPTYFAAAHLAHLVATSNQISQLLHLPPRLIHLNLSKNRVESCGDALFCLLHLQELHISHNPLSQLPRLPRNLLLLDASNCKIKTIGAELWELPLQRLDLSNNMIAVVPHELALSQTLRSLALGGNPQRAIRYQVLQSGCEKVLRYLGNKLPEDMQAAVDAASQKRCLSAPIGRSENVSGELLKLDAEISSLEEELRDTTGLSGPAKYALKKKLKMAKAKRIRAGRKSKK